VFRRRSNVQATDIIGEGCEEEVWVLSPHPLEVDVLEQICRQECQMMFEPEQILFHRDTGIRSSEAYCISPIHCGARFYDIPLSPLLGEIGGVGIPNFMSILLGVGW
jgi:hypothetical protein